MDGSRNRERRAVGTKLRNLKDAITQLWVERVRAKLDGARHQSEPALVDSLPEVIEALAQALDQSTSEVSKTGHPTVFEQHADARRNWSSYTPDQLVREYGILRKVLLAVLEEEEPLSAEEREFIIDFIDEGIHVAIERYDRLQRFHDRLELHYLELVEGLIAESSNAKAIDESLERLLDVVLHGMRAEAAAILLYPEGRLELRFGSSTGPSPELASMYRAALTLSSVSRPSSEPNAKVRLIEVAMLEPEARRDLEKLQITWLLVLQLPVRGTPAGTLCVGFREKKSLDPIEVQLLEVLGERLSKLLETIQLHDQTTRAMQEVRRESDDRESQLDEERKRRDELLAQIGHDLRNPLQTARMSAELIRRTAPRVGNTESLADRILRSIDRSDRMIQDLLDASRMRAGKKLSLNMEPYSMNALVHEVVKDMVPVNGDRFVIVADEEVIGFWSWEAMRRAVENLLSNAVKYGAADAPITIKVEKVNDRMRLSVHNQGAALTPAEQAKILQPFERGQRAQKSGHKGWGIGLTLVQGIADAHGGVLSVDSSPDGGTTFMIDNPMDSRPFQENEAL